MSRSGVRAASHRWRCAGSVSVAGQSQLEEPSTHRGARVHGHPACHRRARRSPPPRRAPSSPAKPPRPVDVGGRRDDEPSQLLRPGQPQRPERRADRHEDHGDQEGRRQHRRPRYLPGSHAAAPLDWSRRSRSASSLLGEQLERQVADSPHDAERLERRADGVFRVGILADPVVTDREHERLNRRGPLALGPATARDAVRDLVGGPFDVCSLGPSARLLTWCPTHRATSVYDERIRRGSPLALP